MSHERNIKWLHDRRIITRCYPWSDKPSSETDVYWFYQNGTYQCYTLFASKAKITTYKSLKWHFLAFIKQSVLNHMIKEVINSGIDPPINKIRKVIFKPGIILSTNQKLSIVGKLIGRSKVTEDIIYSTMIEINHLGEKITLNKIAQNLNCSVRTLHRNMSKQLKQEKESLNEEI